MITSFQNIKAVYFLGIGGIGMSALARYFRHLGKEVYGYDKTSSELTTELQNEGAIIHFNDDVGFAKKINEQFGDSLLVIRTPAVPIDHGELNYFSQTGSSMMKRSQVLGEISKNYFTVAVAGTHGKTTTSTILAHLLNDAGLPVLAVLGGIAKNFNSNLLLPELDKEKVIMVVEADEYDRSFLALHPDIAIITSMDADHLDIYGNASYMQQSYLMFASQVKEHGKIFHYHSLNVGNTAAQKLTYSDSDPSADFTATDIQINDHKFEFTFNGNHEKVQKCFLPMPGRHNIANATAAMAVAQSLGVAPEQIKKSLAKFEGVKRRFDYRINRSDFVFIDDYAHHPSELSACIGAVKELYAGKKITGIFQPHLYSRTRDFADDFAKSLSMLDELILLDIYPARELPMEGVTSEIIFDKVITANKTLCTKSELMQRIKERKVEVLLTLGAGDIDRFIQPLQQYFDTQV